MRTESPSHTVASIPARLGEKASTRGWYASRIADTGWCPFDAGQDGRIRAYVDERVHVLQPAPVAEHQVNLRSIDPAAIF
jgi:hypothetical protein